jgi:hypothetical protein
MMIGSAMMARALLVHCTKGKVPDMMTARSQEIRAAFAQQAAFVRSTGSPLTGAVLLALVEVLDHETRAGATILDWPGDAMADVLMLRIAGGLNALAQSGRDAELSALYAARKGDFSAVLKRVLRQWDDALLPWLESPPQTNEVARSGVLWPGLMAIAARFGPMLELLELGSSAGLNLNMDRFGYDLGGVKAGDPASPLQFAPEWDGPPPPLSAIEIVGRAGVDKNPLDVGEDKVVERLMAYIWPDQDLRVARAAAAIRIARAHPPAVEAGDAAAWIERRLAAPQADGVTRVVFHSIVLQYMPPEGRARVAAALHAAGRHATRERPLAWLSMEFHEVATQGDLRLTCWPGAGNYTLLARVHPHGAKISWVG